MPEQRKVEAGDTLAKIDESKAQKKARLAAVLDRGFVNTRLEVAIPPGTYGEWVRNDATEIARMQALGFEVDTKYAREKPDLHGAQDGTGKVGDVIFMTTSKENKELLEEVQRERYLQRHGGDSQVEERAFTSEAGLPTINESTVEEVDENAIKSAVRERR